MSVPTSDYQRVSIPFDFRDDDLNPGIWRSVVYALDRIEIGRACDDGFHVPIKG